MDIVILFPALLCTAGLYFWGAPRTFLNICLPILVLLPTYFYWKVNGFPNVDFSLAVLMPLGVALVPLLGLRWKWTRSDLWMLLYILSSAAADFRFGETSLAKYRLFDVIFAALVPYMAGKLLIEQAGARFETVKRIVQILWLSCLVAIPEFVIKINLFSRIGMHIFPGQWPGWSTQLRWGFGRVAGPYGTAEIYGLILGTGLLLLLWIQQWSTPALPFLRPHVVSSKRLVQLALLTLVTTLLMTQSRGPWLGTLLALPFALAGRAKNVKRAALLVGLGIVSVAVPAYIAVDHYTSGPRVNYGTEQETAQYRRQLLINYLPLAEQGGLWGWGTFHPVLDGQPSIDNEFLRVFLTQGYIGVAAYMLLILEAGISLVRVGISAELREDRHFCFTLFGIIAGWTLTLSTVYMGAQSYELFFLLAGWTQVIPRVRVNASSSLELAGQDKTETLELTRVYT